MLAYANQFPVVLTDPNSLSTQAVTTLQALGIKQAIVLGGPLAVSTGDVTSIQGLGISVIRVAGQDATDTAQELATLELQSTTLHAGLGWSTGWGNKILVARGDFYSDALAGCALAAIAPTPLLLTENPGTVGQYLGAFLNQGGRGRDRWAGCERQHPDDPTAWWLSRAVLHDAADHGGRCRRRVILGDTTEREKRALRARFSRFSAKTASSVNVL